MKGTLFFVHGTGVRNEGWVPLFQRVQDYARIQGFTGVHFEGCAWGPKLGVRLDLLPETLPIPIVTKGDTAPSPEEIEKATWSFLLDDPLFELRIAAEGSGGEGMARSGVLMPDQAAEALIRQLAAKAASLDLARTGLTASEVARAAETVAASPELQRAALAAGSASDPDLVRAAARSVLAHVLVAHRSEPAGQAPAALFDGELRNAIVRAIEKALLPDVRGFRDWVKEKVTAFALQKATRFGEDRREGLLGGGTPFLGDILFYQRRGREILDFLEAALRKPDLPRPIVAVGHSLGGIMLVDLLSRGKDAPPVDLLVTAGSQAPMLYAIDALEHLRPGNGAVPFTPWLNLYNPQDFLSFCAERVFPGVAGIDDQKVDPQVPFPESHSAYWYHPEVYELIRGAWPA